MSDFASRLERELIAAAKREERRPRMLPRLPTPRRWSPALAIATAVAALALALAPALRSPHDSNPPTKPLRPLPAALLGDYSRSTSRGATSLILDRTRYTLVLPAGEDTGDVAAAGSLLVLSSDGNGPCRYQDGRGQYRFERHGDTLRLHRLADGCRARAQALDGGSLRYRG
jgi:hypothetical protein